MNQTRSFFVLFFITLSCFIFGQEAETPSVLIELNTGYAFGINMDSSLPIELKMVYPYTRFGITIEGGALLHSDNKAGVHFFVGPTLFIINNPKIRLPISVGFDLMVKNSTYFGLGGIVSFNYSLAKNLYLGINTEVNFYINHPYEEAVGIDTKDASIWTNPITGKKVYLTDKNGKNIEVIYAERKEMKNHFGRYIHIKPTIAIGIQF